MDGGRSENTHTHTLARARGAPNGKRAGNAKLKLVCILVWLADLNLDAPRKVRVRPHTHTHATHRRTNAISHKVCRHTYARTNTNHSSTTHRVCPRLATDEYAGRRHCANNRPTNRNARCLIWLMHRRLRRFNPHNLIIYRTCLLIFLHNHETFQTAATAGEYSAARIAWLRRRARVCPSKLNLKPTELPTCMRTKSCRAHYMKRCWPRACRVTGRVNASFPQHGSYIAREFVGIASILASTRLGTRHVLSFLTDQSYIWRWRSAVPVRTLLLRV